MNRKLLSSVSPWSPSLIDQYSYDAFVGAVGYEERSRYVATKLKGSFEQGYACAFTDRNELSFSENLDWYRENGFEVTFADDDEFANWCNQILQKISESGDQPRVAVDISSMSRYRIATFLTSICDRSETTPIDVDFLYSPATFSPPSYEEGAIVWCGPVNDVFAGWTTEPQEAPVVVLGLGYERDKAVGVTEYIEAGEVWAFKPIGEDNRFAVEVNRANENLLELLSEDRQIDYEVIRPSESFATLESLVFGIVREKRLILVPFGPKIFTLLCLLAAIVYYPQVSVWRVSSGQHEPPIDRKPSGTIVGIRTRFSNFD